MTFLARLRSFLVLALFVLAAACNNGSSSPTAPDQRAIPYSQVDLTVGTGAEAAVGKSATVQYAGWLYSDTGPDHKGAQFDAGQLAPFVIGSNTLIKGFDMAVSGMKVGGIRRAVIPPSLAYGSTGSSSIPPNAALVFEILLGNVQ